MHLLSMQAHDTGMMACKGRLSGRAYQLPPVPAVCALLLAEPLASSQLGLGTGPSGRCRSQGSLRLGMTSLHRSDHDRISAANISHSPVLLANAGYSPGAERTLC